jgi:hypothetical protein
MKLHYELESRNDRGTDWSVARSLEDRIGAGQPVAGDIELPHTAGRRPLLIYRYS